MKHIVDKINMPQVPASPPPPHNQKTVKAVILVHAHAIISSQVGGPSRGTRFRPLSMSNGPPKPLFPVAGQPMIQHHIRALNDLNDTVVNGWHVVIKEVLIVGFYAEDVGFTDFIRQASREFPNLSLRYLREFESLGTGGGLYHFRDQIQRNNADLFFVLHADICSSFPLKQMLQFHIEKSKLHPIILATILGTKVPKEMVSAYGCIVQSDETNEVQHYVEKPETFVSDLISCGIYLFDRNIFDEMHESVTEKVETDEPGRDGMVKLETDVLRNIAGSGKLFVYETKDFWRQIKTAGYVRAIVFNCLDLQFLPTSAT